MAKRSRVVILGNQELKDKLKKLGQAVVEFNGKAALAGGEVIHNAAEPNAPGPHIGIELVRSDEDQAEVHIGPDKEHWHYQFTETGATAHEIKAGRGARRQARLAGGGRANKQTLQAVSENARLVFEGSSGLVITKAVNHPGMAARPFLRPAMLRKREEAKKQAGDVFRTAIEKAAPDAH